LYPFSFVDGCLSLEVWVERSLAASHLIVHAAPVGEASDGIITFSWNFRNAFKASAAIALRD